MDYVHGRAATDTAPQVHALVDRQGPRAVWCPPGGMTFAPHPIFHSRVQNSDLL
jgi:hypothetical protein